MTQNILKEGEVKLLELSCPQCSTIFESDEYDVMGQSYIDQCPKCKAKIPMEIKLVIGTGSEDE